uniref:Uncharacterized protein n=1 Tax=Anopheles stephensi TaxID=30069 RepID=A0A182Y5Q5_ANOST
MSGPPNINNNQLPPSTGGGSGGGTGRGWLRTPPPTYFRSPSPWVPPGSAPPARQSSPVTTAMPRPADAHSGIGGRGPSEFVYQHPSSGAFGGAAYPAHQYAGDRPTMQSTSAIRTTTTATTATSAQEFQFQRPIPSAMTPTHFVGSTSTHYRPVSPAAVAPQPYPQFSATMSPVSSLHRSMTPHSIASSYGPVEYHQQQQMRPGSTQSSVYGGVTYHYGPAAAGPGHHPQAQSQYVIYDYGGEMGPSTAEIIAAQSQDYVDEKLAEYQATIMLLQVSVY